MRTVKETMTLEELRQMAAATFGNLMKAVVDVKKEVIALDAELHSDLEALLLENGSAQEDLWGINLYPEISGEGFIEFDSVINLRPSQGNKSRGVDSEELRKKITVIVSKRIICR